MSEIKVKKNQILLTTPFEIGQTVKTKLGFNEMYTVIAFEILHCSASGEADLYNVLVGDADGRPVTFRSFELVDGEVEI